MPRKVPLVEPRSSTNQRVVAVEDPGVPAAGEVVVEDEGALGVAADEGAGLAQRQRGAGQRALGDDEGGGDARRAAARPWRGFGGCGAASPRPGGRRASWRAPGLRGVRLTTRVP